MSSISHKKAPEIEVFTPNPTTSQAEQREKSFRAHGVCLPRAHITSRQYRWSDHQRVFFMLKKTDRLLPYKSQTTDNDNSLH